MSGTLTPFLYQTRTLRKLLSSRSLATTSTIFRGLHTTSRVRSRDPIPFELPPELESQNPDSRDDENHRRSTITPAEKKAFDRIFQEIATRKSSSSHQPKARARKAGAGKAKPSPNNAINVIIADAAAEQASELQRSPMLFEPPSFEGTFSAADRKSALMRFPPSLRKAARMALGAPGQTLGHEPEEEDLPWGDELAAEEGAKVGEGAMPMDLDSLTQAFEQSGVRREERTRVQEKMKRAPSDFALWDVVEEEVFSMVDRLGLGAPDTTKPPRRTGKTKAGLASLPASAKDLSMEVHAPLYPSHLCYALHRFDVGFGPSSPLALSVLPRVKQLGLASYVLGAGTPFYTRLIAIYWYRYGDGAAVLGLLEEMRQAGLYFDKKLQPVVQDMFKSYGHMKGGHVGGFQRKLMRMPEHEAVLRTRDQWLRTISKNVEERAAAM
ncbi:hypothetical protein NKR23_g5768 [Pleurostoma richardsiae]|uniref:Mtf2-like C-terminal domain-containing protein n=1 Tax=Pleurostoma richardsiae TaxID=41990 RepID=A0AA38RSQ5_9PEZI|nr:hypothetical protein NKR23_g5768 [Pleurostoma richardsiae]